MTRTLTYDTSGSSVHIAELFVSVDVIIVASSQTVDDFVSDEWDESLMRQRPFEEF